MTKEVITIITIKDIAEKAGVSTMTVSNVINGKHSKVSKKNIDKINHLVEEYNYIPNSAARLLSSSNSKIVALFLPNCDIENPHNVQLLKSISEQVNQRGYFIMFFSNITDLKTIYSHLKTWNVDGVICFAPLSNQDFKLFEQLKVPACFIDSYYSSEHIIRVGIDDFHSGFMAAGYLVKCGHTRIGFASYHPSYDMILQNRFDGFKASLRQNGLDLPEENIFLSTTDYRGGMDVANQIADRNQDITAIFATEDEMAIGIMEGARLNGIDVPGQLSIIGFDNTPFCEYVTPKLTTISQDIAQKGEVAAQLLFDLIEHKSIEQKVVKLPVRIVERQSVRKINTLE